MRNTIMAAVAATLITTPIMAGGLSSPWDEPEITVIPCPTYGVLWGTIKWEWCPGQLTNSFNDYDDEPRPVPSDFPKDTPDEDTPDDDDPKDTPKDTPKGKPDRVKGNNGHGNGDQAAPGNSRNNNNAENSGNSGRGNSGNGGGGKRGTPNAD